ncbi:thioredoxin family protein [Nocardia sp. NPDC059091]|uniref:thioredoxin family protein n=1 Tax=unclassified Nocardia TaxID=2637762 RepID=UPI00368EB73D
MSSSADPYILRQEGGVRAPDETFEREVLEHPRPVLVEFGAEWCPPCRMVSPVLAAIARERADMLSVCKVDTDEKSFRHSHLPGHVGADPHPLPGW